VLLLSLKKPGSQQLVVAVEEEGLRSSLIDLVVLERSAARKASGAVLSFSAADIFAVSAATSFVFASVLFFAAALPSAAYGCTAALSC